VIGDEKPTKKNRPWKSGLETKPGVLKRHLFQPIRAWQMKPHENFYRTAQDPEAGYNRGFVDRDVVVERPAGVTL